MRRHADRQRRERHERPAAGGHAGGGRLVRRVGHLHPPLLQAGGGLWHGLLPAHAPGRRDGALQGSAGQDKRAFLSGPEPTCCSVPPTCRLVPATRQLLLRRQSYHGCRAQVSSASSVQEAPAGFSGRSPPRRAPWARASGLRPAPKPAPHPPPPRPGAAPCLRPRPRPRQGRACEHILAKTFVKPGSVVPMNFHFTVGGPGRAGRPLCCML